GAAGLVPADLGQAPHQARDLDVVRLVAVLGETRRVVGHEGEAVQVAAQRAGRGARSGLQDAVGVEDAPRAGRVCEPALPVGLSLTALAVLGAPVREGLQVRLLEIALEQAEQSRGLPGLELLKRGGVGAAVVVESVLTAPL